MVTEWHKTEARSFTPGTEHQRADYLAWLARTTGAPLPGWLDETVPQDPGEASRYMYRKAAIDAWDDPAGTLGELAFIAEMMQC